MALHRDYLCELVQIGGRALEHEDRFIAGCMLNNVELYGDSEPRGLLRIRNERYYQFVITRALMSNYRYCVEIEKNGHDFILSDCYGRKPVAVGEMKTWFATNPTVELPSMQKDISNLRKSGYSSFLLVATFWPPAEAQELIRTLSTHLQLDDARRVKEYRFRTAAWNMNGETNKAREFALIGYEVST
jgi:hypothetical protein